MSNIKNSLDEIKQAIVDEAIKYDLNVVEEDIEIYDTKANLTIGADDMSDEDSILYIYFGMLMPSKDVNNHIIIRKALSNTQVIKLIDEIVNYCFYGKDAEILKSKLRLAGII